MLGATTMNWGTEDCMTKNAMCSCTIMMLIPCEQVRVVTYSSANWVQGKFPMMALDRCQFPKGMGMFTRKHGCRMRCMFSLCSS